MFKIELCKSNNIPQDTNSVLKRKRKAPDSTNGNKKQSRKRGKEYYTLYEDIDKQMAEAKKAYSFEDKTVLCNCDNPLESNFFSYFVKNFHTLGLQKLICTCYKKNGKGLKIEIDRDNFATIFGEDFRTKNEKEQDDIIAKFREQEKGELRYIKEMEGNGDCLGEESLKNLENSDIVVTNPPFGQTATNLIQQIVGNNKKFILICELHDILGVKNNKLYNTKEYNIDFGKNNYEMHFMTVDKKKTVQGAKWINNIGISKNNNKNDKNPESRYDDRVRKMLDIDNVYAIPNTSLEKTQKFIEQVYSDNSKAILSVEPSLFYNQNSIFNKEDFNIIGLCDEINEIKDGEARPRIKFGRLERREDSPIRKATKNKNKCTDAQGKPYYQYGGLHVLCKKKVDLAEIKQEDKTMNLDNISKINQIKSFTAKK